jgi:hypothetical protein
LTGLLRKRFFRTADFDYSSTDIELLRLSAAFARKSKIGGGFWGESTFTDFY